MTAHAPSFVILSTTIAVLGAFTACVMTSSLAPLSRSERRWRIIMASVTFGGSLWAMQFVGLLSLTTQVNFAHNPLALAFAAVAALGGAGVALMLVGRRKGAYRARRSLASAILGSAIAATNYLGIAAVAGRSLTFSWFLVLICIAVSIQVAAIVLWVLFRRRGVLMTLAGSVFLGLCLSATHYLAVTSAINLEEVLSTIPPYENAVSGWYLAWSATIMMYLLCSICLCIFVIGQFRDEIE